MDDLSAMDQAVPIDGWADLEYETKIPWDEQENTTDDPTENPWDEQENVTDDPTEELDLCEECQEVPSSWYCEKCHARTCESCYQERRPHKRDDPDHTKVPYAFQYVQ